MALEGGGCPLGAPQNQCLVEMKSWRKGGDRLQQLVSRCSFHPVNGYKLSDCAAAQLEGVRSYPRIDVPTTISPIGACLDNARPEKQFDS
jgi:hypothetical protein